MKPIVKSTNMYLNERQLDLTVILIITKEPVVHEGQPQTLNHCYVPLCKYKFTIQSDSVNRPLQCELCVLRESMQFKREGKGT